jgi:hypothetical protein
MNKIRGHGIIAIGASAGGVETLIESSSPAAPTGTDDSPAGEGGPG